MKCANCGFYYESARVCPNCGAVAEGQSDMVTDATTRERPLGNPTPILVFGILSLALAFALPPLGVVFGIISLVKAGKYFGFVGYPGAGQARAGRRLAIAGIIVSAVMTLLLAAFVLIFTPKKPDAVDLKRQYEVAVEALAKAAEDAKSEAAKKVEEARKALESAFPGEAGKYFGTRDAEQALRDAEAALADAEYAVRGLPAGSVESGVQEHIDDLKKAVDEAQAALDALTGPAEDKK